MSPILSRSTWAIATVVAGIAVVVVWQTIGDQAPAVVVQTPIPGDGNEGVNGNESYAIVEDTTPPEPVSTFDLGEIRNLCPLFSGDFDVTCLRALDERYLDRPATYYEAPPILAVRDFTWREIFRDPVADRGAAASALRRSECLVPEGDIRPDRHDACEAPALARLSILHKACGQTIGEEELLGRYARDAHLRELYDLDLELISPETTDLIEYYRQRDEVDDLWFRVTWQAGKCRSLAAAALVWLPELPMPQGRHSGDYDQSRPLRAAAARLGNEWALSFHSGSEPHFDALKRTRPDLAYATQARMAGENSEEYLPYLTLAKSYALRRGMPLGQVESELRLDRFSAEELEHAEKRAAEIIRASRSGDSDFRVPGT